MVLHGFKEGQHLVNISKSANLLYKLNKIILYYNYNKY